MQRTVAAAKSVDDLHPDGWAGALLLPISLVLFSAGALAWLARISGRLRGVQPPRFRAWWLAMAGDLCALGVVAPVVGAARVVVEWLVPRSKFFSWLDVAAFDFMLCLTLVLVGFQAWRRVKGQGYANALWEAFAFAPILVVLWADLDILPGWAKKHQPGVYARALSTCDLPAHTCTIALTLSDASILELMPNTMVNLELMQGADLKQKSTVILTATWLSGPQLDGLPIQLRDDQTHYVRLRFETPRAGDTCPPQAALAAANKGLPSTAALRIEGLILGSKGKSKFYSVIQEIEKPVPPEWGRTMVAVCLSASPSPSSFASSASTAAAPAR